jgi:VWFA-related protein
MRFSRTTAKRASFARRFFLLLPPALLAASCAQETTLHSRSNLVLVPTLVKDSQGSTIYGLESKDFIVEDDGQEQAIRLEEAPDAPSVSLVVAIQTGRRAEYEFPRLEGLKTMLSPLFALGTARVAVVEFDSRVQLTRKFTEAEMLVDADLSHLEPGDSGAAILDAVAFSIDLLNREPEGRERVLLLISETRDHGSKERIEDAVAAVGQANATMYALAFSPALSNILDTGRGNNVEEMHEGIHFLDLGYRVAQAMRKNVPSTVASMTGGEYELFATRKKFEVRINEFTNHLGSRYLLSFSPKDPHPGLHRIVVRLQGESKSKNTVLARTSYWAEASK